MFTAQNIMWLPKIGKVRMTTAEAAAAVAAVAAAAAAAIATRASTKLCSVTHLWCNLFISSLPLSSSEPNSIKSRRQWLHLCKADAYSFHFARVNENRTHRTKPVLWPIDFFLCVWMFGERSQDVIKCPQLQLYSTQPIFVCVLLLFNIKLQLFGEH